jgi:AcrR family transcriptional regulator
MSIARRGRPRDETCTPAILSATLEVVAEIGIAGLTIDAVAKRAGVGKATIYRRWSSKESLTLDAWMSCIRPKPEPDTGTLRGDLLEMFGPVDQQLSDADMQRVFPQLIAAAKVNPEVADAYRAFITERRRPLRRVLERGTERGELPPGVDLDLVHDLLVAPVVYRWVVSDGVIDEAMVITLVDTVLAGARAQAVAAAAP